jgi:glycine hydroxymethyltransferase
VFFALMQPGDTFMGLDLAAGGHLTHGAPANQSGKWFKVQPYTASAVRTSSSTMEEVERIARETKPKVIVAGGSAYARHWDFARFRAIADEVGAYLMVDMAHFAGLVAGGAHPSPVPHAHVDDHDHAQDAARPARRHDPHQRRGAGEESSIQRGLPGASGRPADACDRRQGGGLRRGAAAGIQAPMPEAGGADNAKALAVELKAQGFDLVTDGTDNHLVLVDLRPKKLTGKAAEGALEPRPPDLQQERHPLRPGEADGHLRRPPRHARPRPAGASGKASSPRSAR